MMGAGTKLSRPVRDGHALRSADRPQPGLLDPVRSIYLRLRLRPSCIFAAAGGTAGRDLRLGRSTDRTKTKGSASDSKPSAINTWPPSGASAGSHGAFGRESAIRATPEAQLRFPPTSVSQGWVRFVRFQEVERTQQMTDMGAEPSIL